MDFFNRLDRYVYDGWDTAKPGAIGTENFDEVADLDSNGNVVTRRVYGAEFDDLVARIDSNGDTLWYDADRQGSVRQVFDNSGTSKASVDYDAFGGILSGVLEIVTRRHDAVRFEVQPKRWIVERTFGWFGRYRRLAKDYETIPKSSEAWIQISMIHRMSRFELPNRNRDDDLLQRPKPQIVMGN